MNITYYVKTIYGEDRRYPVSEDAKMICALMGTKTLTISALTILHRYGYVNARVGEPLEKVPGQIA